jgi:uncharacterized damage-inducible protein DinB
MRFGRLASGATRREQMPDIRLNDLVAYTDWDREKWREWFRKQGDEPLKIGAGPHGDGRFGTVGDVIKHIFSAEKRYVERLSGHALTDTAALPADKFESLFELGDESRRGLKTFLETFPAQEWDAPQEFRLMNSYLKATPRKIMVHVLMHEIRHWAQVATLLRLNGLAVEMRDFLFSPVYGGEFRREEQKA